MNTLEKIAESVAGNGFWSRDAIKAGKRIWRRADKIALDDYITGLGFTPGTGEFDGARYELMTQVSRLCMNLGRE